ncbi:MAG: tetratricopeptide repeat-containing serine protease family protein [Verrucomicrobiae bacterium]
MKMKSCLAASLMFVFFTGVQLHAHAQQTAGGQESFEVIKTKAENGDADAQLNLGLYYAHDKGGAKDMTEAVKWYRKAAEQNNAKAQFELGFCYSDGQGVKKSPDEAVKWYRKSALQGNAFAQGSLGAMYFDGADVKRDYYEAFKWFRKAAEQGIDYAQLYLGCIYSKGMGATEKDDVQAAKWLTRAAKQGNSQAQGVLGECYLNGEGVAQDYIEAYKWFNLSAAHKDLQNTQGISAQERSSLIQLMTSAQIAEGQRRAAAFVPRKEIPGLSSDNSNPPETSMGSGTGFFITDDGYLISNYHVVKDAAKVRLVTSAGTIDAKVVQVDAANDLALLKTDGKFSPLPIAASRSAHLGGTVVTIGFPDPSLQGFSPKLAKGEIASLSGAGDDPRYFQISVPVQPGNSGGALVDEHGNVIGIVSAKLDASAALAASGQLPENVNYAVKSSLLLSFLESAPDVASKLKEPNTKDEKFEDVVKSAQDAAVLVLVY